jgi:hypothetical protein
MRFLFVLVIAFVFGSAACELSPQSFPAFGERCEEDGDCEGDGYVCFRKEADDVRGICVDESTLEGESGEGEGENAGEGEGEGEGEPPPCDPPCAGNQVCVNNVCRIACDADTPCAGFLACCDGGCTTLGNCDECTPPNGTCGTGDSCIVTSFTQSDGICVDQASAGDRVSNFESCTTFQAGNVCQPGSTCAAFGEQTVCIEPCVTDNDCPGGQTCRRDSGVGFCERRCEVLASVCGGGMPTCRVEADCTGRCGIAGPRSPGEACDFEDNLCQAGAECIEGFCRSYCDPFGANSCGAGFACRPVCNEATVGICEASCTPLTSAECGGATPNCNVGIGCSAFCEEAGAVGIGGVCTFFSDCAQGLTCTSAGAASGFTCREKCDPQAPACPLGGGTCTANTDCAEEGVCVP